MSFQITKTYMRDFKRNFDYFLKFLFLFIVFCGKVLKLKEIGDSVRRDFRRRRICGKHLTTF